MFSPTAARRTAFAKAMAGELGIESSPSTRPEMAVAGADIVASCTDSMDPTIRAGWLAPGMHVTNVVAMRQT